MTTVSGPYLVREGGPAAEPGVHSYNRARRGMPQPVTPPRGRLFGLRLVLLIAGLAGLGYYAVNVADETIYQAYENWSFDQQIAGRSSVNFADYLREKTPFGFVLGKQPAPPATPVAKPPDLPPRPAYGSVLGRVSIPRLGISAIVREGVDAGTLSKAVGHVPSTSLPGQAGNFSIAAHRDTLFRALRNIRLGDQVMFQSTSGTYVYRVIATQIVRPSDVSVLRGDGGPGLLRQVADHPPKLLTMITCYPFNYIGSAPSRFIVQAAETNGTAPEVQGAGMRPVRGVVGTRAATPVLQHETDSKLKKPGFWHRLFSLS